MNIFNQPLLFKRISIVVSFAIVSLILWNTYIFFQKFKQEERTKMEILAEAQKELSKADLNSNIALPDKIITTNNSIPMILVDENDEIIYANNLDSIKSLNPEYLQKQLAMMKKDNKPIVISYDGKNKQFIYYSDSDLLKKLTYYPLALILILVLFLSVIYLFYSSNKAAETNKLWTGMAKETAHQIGTPLSSLLGWIAILKAEKVDKTYIYEIEKDVHRLNAIANRFSKIGSVPELKKRDVVLVTKQAFDYLKSRSSEQITFYYSTNENEIKTLLNQELFGWVIENLIKNAIDAMLGKGEIQLNIESSEKKVRILVSDTGKGMPKKLFKQIFKPGFTTKKRGWGLGLSLSKRIVEDYHKGKIFVQKSEIGKGTTFEIILDKIS
ncbi:MAG: HAMP domain-containing histidine kinase [Flavobacteriia bacterium]|nr:HAMP domain-containing histidine kinase [Flavobacteriia bacterium]OIP48642.1 MAG: two-component sensor histidine kinase [Flavobacteriaceae bacterium CG2_30_31_66]PIV95587.1 MAG: two-component sensor histidine kinase [Flavobacteriaceae bacterium CG17_big_fil_post_rev_8_21_14_2_50_31_13]PIX12373.1 MAG: two-component sensor histidine kinase [Flavobacteriaceae bacterium CG_4_8_14_3_um_filter_31_8]PIY15966.1 MAG: two-component sensor histidine kinase [Flavobacteriaceae bacterium CG_4_10_14_3_um_f